MQFPRYELTLPLHAERDAAPRVPRRPPPGSRVRARPRAGLECARARAALAALTARGARRRPPERLDAQQYLALEFTVDDRG